MCPVVTTGQKFGQILRMVGSGLRGCSAGSIYSVSYVHGFPRRFYMVTSFKEVLQDLGCHGFLLGFYFFHGLCLARSLLSRCMSFFQDVYQESNVPPITTPYPVPQLQSVQHTCTCEISVPSAKAIPSGRDQGFRRSIASMMSPRRPRWSLIVWMDFLTNWEPNTLQSNPMLAIITAEVLIERLILFSGFRFIDTSVVAVSSLTLIHH